MAQVHTAVQSALSDGHVLLEVEMPLASGLGVNSGDSIAISEYNANMQALRKFTRLWEWLGTESSVRVFFPDAAEASIAINGAGLNPVSGQWEQRPTFDDFGGEIDYLLRDDILSQTSRRSYGLAELPEKLTGKREVEETAEIDDRLYVIGYPYDNSDEMVTVMKLWDAHARPTIVFNGNLDSIRTGFFPFGAGRKLKQEFVPSFETAYYIHFFRSATAPGALFRAYPGKWQVLRTMSGGGLECVREYDERPVLREVALEYFSGGLTTAAVAESSAPKRELSDDSTAHYAALGIERTATQEEVQAAYRAKARQLHPDRPDGDAMQFYALSNAYAVLRDPETRALYDEHGERWVEKRDE